MGENKAIKKFSLGYNQDIQMLGLLAIFREHIRDVYFPLPKSILGSGRVVEQASNYDFEISQIIKFSKENKIDPVLAINPTCEGEMTGTEASKKRITGFIEANLGIKGVILTNPLHARPIKQKFPKMRIIASVNCYIKNVESAEYLKKLGFDEITIDRDINRNIPLIREIRKKTGLKIRVMLNEGCLRNCPFRKIHFNMISHGYETDYFDQNTCMKILKKEPEKVFSIPFVRPEDLQHYDFADTFKLATRTTPTEKIAYVLEAYAAGKFDGDLLDLLSTRSLFAVFNNIDNHKLTELNFFENITKENNEEFVKKLMKEAVKLT